MTYQTRDMLMEENTRLRAELREVKDQFSACEAEKTAVVESKENVISISQGMAVELKEVKQSAVDRLAKINELQNELARMQTEAAVTKALSNARENELLGKIRHLKEVVTYVQQVHGIANEIKLYIGSRLLAMM